MASQFDLQILIADSCICTPKMPAGATLLWDPKWRASFDTFTHGWDTIHTCRNKGDFPFAQSPNNLCQTPCSAPAGETFMVFTEGCGCHCTQAHGERFCFKTNSVCSEKLCTKCPHHAWYVPLYQERFWHCSWNRRCSTYTDLVAHTDLGWTRNYGAAWVYPFVVT